MEKEKALATTFRAPLEAMKRLIEERKDLVVRIGDNYEISRPLALELWRILTEEVLRHGGSIKESMRVEHADEKMVIVSISCTITTQTGSELTFCEIGEAYARERGKEDTLARTAFTRAMKRLLERITGEDFINQVILKLFPKEVREVPASERQKELIKKLVDEGKITQELIEELKKEGKLPADFRLGNALKEGKLTSGQAKAILDRALR